MPSAMALDWPGSRKQWWLATKSLEKGTKRASIFVLQLLYKFACDTSNAPTDTFWNNMKLVCKKPVFSHLPSQHICDTSAVDEQITKNYSQVIQACFILSESSVNSCYLLNYACSVFCSDQINFETSINFETCHSFFCPCRLVKSDKPGSMQT